MHRREQQTRGVRAGLVHIDVRISLEADDHVRVVDHLLRDVAVQIECDGDRRIRQCGAHAFEQIAFAVVRIFRDHRAVQIEHHSVASVCGCNDCIADRVVGRSVDGSARVRRCRHGRHDMRALARGGVDERGHRGLHALVVVERVVAETWAELPAVQAECRQRRGHRRERVGLVIHPIIAAGATRAR
jgi:hypothetical protein